MGEPETPADFTQARKIRRELAKNFRTRDAALLRALGFSLDRSARIMDVSTATVRRYQRARDEP